VNAVTSRLQIRMPKTFVNVPHEGVAGIPGLSTEISAEIRARLTGSIDPQASAFVVLPPPPAVPAVGAVGWFTASLARVSLGDLLTEAAASDLWNDSSSFVTTPRLHQLGSRLVLTVHLMQSLEPAEGETFEAQLVERCSSTMYDPQRRLAIRLELTAFDLKLFPDIVATSIEILESAQVVA
jgi:hypothetical protein